MEFRQKSEKNADFLPPYLYESFSSKYPSVPLNISMLSVTKFLEMSIAKGRKSGQPILERHIVQGLTAKSSPPYQILEN